MSEVYQKALKIKRLIRSFKRSEFYRFVRTTESGCKTFWLMCKNELVEDQKDKFGVYLKMEDKGIALGFLLNLGKPTAFENSVCVFQNSMNCKLLGNFIPWMPEKSFDPKFFQNSSFNSGWYVTHETVMSIYKETIEILRIAKRLEKRGLYFQSCWEPSAFGKIWISDYKEFYPISPKKCRKLLSELYTENTLESFWDSSEFIKARDQFIEESLRDRSKINLVLKSDAHFDVVDQ